MTTAAVMFLRQITLTGGIPFDVSLPEVLAAINADAMRVEQLRAGLMTGYEDMKQGNTQDTSAVFAKYLEAHR